MPRGEGHSPAAQALRDAVEAMAEKHKARVDCIKANVRHE